MATPITPTIAIIVPTPESIGASFLAAAIADYATGKRRRVTLLGMDPKGVLCRMYGDRDADNNLALEQSPQGVRHAEFADIVPTAARERAGYVVFDGSGLGRRDLYAWEDAMDELARHASAWPGPIIVFAVTNGGPRPAFEIRRLQERYSGSALHIVPAAVPLLRIKDRAFWPDGSLPIPLLNGESWMALDESGLDFSIGSRHKRFGPSDRVYIASWRRDFAALMDHTVARTPDAAQLAPALRDEYYLPPDADLTLPGLQPSPAIENE